MLATQIVLLDQLRFKVFLTEQGLPNKDLEAQLVEQPDLHYFPDYVVCPHLNRYTRVMLPRSLSFRVTLTLLLRKGAVGGVGGLWWWAKGHPLKALRPSQNVTRASYSSASGVFSLRRKDRLLLRSRVCISIA